MKANQRPQRREDSRALHAACAGHEAPRPGAPTSTFRMTKLQSQPRLGRLVPHHHAVKPSRIALILCVALLSACANPYKEAADAYDQTLISRWGPMNKWTPEQKQAGLDGLMDLMDRMKQQQSASAQRVVLQQPAYNPFPLPEREFPQAHSSYAHSSYPSHIEPNGRGGYTVWNNDGTTHTVTPDGRGGWTVW